MMRQPIPTVARELGVDHHHILYRIHSGQIGATRTNRRYWLVDPDEVRRSFEERPPKRHRRSRKPKLPAPTAEPAPPGELTDIQRQGIASEDGHVLIDLQPDHGSPGAIRTWWSDGEAYTLLPNGEQTSFRYAEDKGQ